MPLAEQTHKHAHRNDSPLATEEELRDTAAACEEKTLLSVHPYVPHLHVKHGDAPVMLCTLSAVEAQYTLHSSC